MIGVHFFEVLNLELFDMIGRNAIWLTQRKPYECYYEFSWKPRNVGPFYVQRDLKKQSHELRKTYSQQL